ncbi:GNAT family N-acetyltransferase [Brucella grignonensis]|uniref:Acetyltransferase family protein n=1 Tax=Brucella grignonensis TaxID=94627 RepID=A0A256FG11_9HYPH|nr:N-acetyltransferase [Brucella grignonensis]NKB83508.1 N-acetyltransferase [Brucella grignonensis]OYR13807.1 acetyltransferase family protein [Brucella grignonensis]
MQQLELTYAPEDPAHDIEIEDMNAEAFGPGRFTRAAHFIREGGPHDNSLSFVALMGGIVIGSLRMTPVVVGKTPALLLGPLAVRPDWKKRGIGGTLMRMSLEAAKNAGHKLVILVGDQPYYGPFGFNMVQPGSMIMPAPVDPQRMLACELVSGALSGVGGIVRHANRA